MTDYLALARSAAEESYGKTAVGEAAGVMQENQDGLLSYLFKCKLKGYPDWQIAVTLFIQGWDASVSEVVLVPGETSLVAPKWVPWSERLADYKALQAALEAEAAIAEAIAAEEGYVEDSEDADDSDESEDFVDTFDDSDESIGADESAEEAEEELAASDVPEAVEPESDADTAGGKSKGFFKWKTLRANKKRK